MRTCLICKREITGNKCEYDGFVTFTTFQDSVPESELKRAQAYREKLLSSITFFIEAKEYKWNEKAMKLETIRTMDVKIADGKSCFGKIVWADQPFGQSLEDKPTQSEKEFVINYKVKDQKRSETLKITPVQCSDFWHIGVKINEDFTFNVVLGTPDNYATSSTAQLILH